MAQHLKVFVSHSHVDDTFCREIVKGLREAGADVWYDEHNLGSGQLMEVIQRELDQRPIFVLILSKSAFASRWVKREATWAFQLGDRDPSRLMVPVTAGQIEHTDFSGTAGWLFLSDFKRIEAAGMRPYLLEEACGRLLHALGLPPAGEGTPTPTSHADESSDELISQGKGLLAQGKYAEATLLLEMATQRQPGRFDAWAVLGLTYRHEHRSLEALTAYDQALILDEKQAWVWNGKGQALEDVHRGAEALAAYDRALALDPKDALFLYNKRLLLRSLGRSNEAEQPDQRARWLEELDG